MNHNLKHIMLDIETLDVLPTATITQIAACSFSLEDGITNHFNTYVLATSQSWGSASKATLDWLASLPPKEPIGSAVPIREALKALSSYLQGEDYDGIWCYGASFDFPILRLAYHHTNLPLPWHYRQERCLRTILALKNTKLRATNNHDALSDVYNQAATLLEEWHELGL